MDSIEKMQSDILYLTVELKKIKEVITVNENETTYNTEQVATLLGITKAGVNFHIRKGNIQTKGGKGRCKEITESELNRYIKTHKVKSK